MHRAILREDGELEVAIKKVILDSELHDIIKEIAIMQQCESPFVVRYYGSYFANQSLWIVMEYCGGGSISDLLRARKQPLDEGRLQNCPQRVANLTKILEISVFVSRARVNISCSHGYAQRPRLSS